MNISEFKAWFEGFTERMDGPPDEEDWARIQERVAEITEKPTPAPVIIRELERWTPRLPRPWWDRPYVTFIGSTGSPMPDRGQWICNNSADAFRDIGRAESVA